VGRNPAQGSGHYGVFRQTFGQEEEISWVSLKRRQLDDVESSPENTPPGSSAQRTFSLLNMLRPSGRFALPAGIQG